MLILTRQIGETLMINDNVAITVQGIKGYQVSFGINAPREVAVHREEIYQRLQNQSAAEKKSGAKIWERRR